MNTHPSCACCAGLLQGRYDRRRFLQLAGSAGLVATLPFPALAATGNYEAMVVNCMDPRFPEHMRAYTAGRGLTGKFSHFVVAGAAIGIVAPAFKDWHKTFWDNLGASIQLHNIQKIIVINHRDCGAARLGYGEAAVANPKVETETHHASLAEFRKHAKERHPKLAVETGLMNIDGKVETLG
jgi:carbonic anhydrase